MIVRVVPIERLVKCRRAGWRGRLVTRPTGRPRHQRKCPWRLPFVAVPRCMVLVGNDFRQRQAGLCPIILLPSPSFERKEIDMESIISNLLTRFEKGSLSRRELVRGLAILAASGTAAAAQEDID